MLAYYRNEEFETTALRPYKSSDGRYICHFEGALVNEQALREQLEKTGIYFSSSRIEEVILELYHFCGDSFVTLLRGKFTVLIFDGKHHQLMATRDRYGVCPLYYKLIADGIGMATVLTDFKSHEGELMNQLHTNVLRHYFSYGYFPEEDTYLKHVHHVPAGCFLKYDDDQGLAITPFADLLVIEGSHHQLIDEQLFHDVVAESIHSRLLANKVVGVLDTGQVGDLVIAAVARQAGIEVKMFSAEFGKKSVRDTSLEANCNYRNVSASDYWHAAVATIQATGVPLADPFAPIDYLLSELASKHVDVILSSAGADVLFGTGKKLFDPLKKRNNGLIFTEDDKEQLLKFEGNPWNEITAPYLAQISDLGPVLKWQTLTLNTRLKGSIVLKTERLATHHGLEASFPFLDDNVLDMANFLTIEEKKSMFLFKQCFAAQISKFQPAKKKATYKMPLATWIRTDLYDVVRATFEQDIVEAFFNPEPLLAMLEQHRKGLRDLSSRIWAVTMFIVWLKTVTK